MRLRTGPDRVAPGTAYAWQFAGPAADQYVLAIDADTVATDGTVRTGTVLFGPAPLPGCRSTQIKSTAPTVIGEHAVVLFRRTANEWQRVAESSLTVK